MQLLPIGVEDVFFTVAPILSHMLALSLYFLLSFFFVFLSFYPLGLSSQE